MFDRLQRLDEQLLARIDEDPSLVVKASLGLMTVMAMLMVAAFAFLGEWTYVGLILMSLAIVGLHRFDKRAREAVAGMPLPRPRQPLMNTIGPAAMVLVGGAKLLDGNVTGIVLISGAIGFWSGMRRRSLRGVAPSQHHGRGSNPAQRAR